MPADRHIPVTDLLAVGPGDEAGTPDDEIVECACGALHRRGDETHPRVCPEATGEAER